MKKALFGFLLFALVGCMGPQTGAEYVTSGNLLTAIGPYQNDPGIQVILLIWTKGTFLYGPHHKKSGGNVFEDTKFVEKIEVYPVEKIPHEILGKPLWKDVTIDYTIVNEEIPLVYLKDFKLEKKERSM